MIESNTETFDPLKVKRLPISKLLKQIGPGIILTGTTIGPGLLTTAAMLGANFNYSLLWLFIPIAIMGFAFVYSSYLVSLLTDKPVIHAIRHYYGGKAAAFVGITLFISCTFFTIGNITGTGAGMHLIFGMDWKIGAIIMLIVLSLIYLSKNVYNKVEGIMSVLVFGMAIAFMYTLIDIGGPDYNQVSDGFFHWSIPAGGMLTIVGFLGSSASITTGVYGTYLAKEKGWKKENLFNGSIMADTISHIIGVVLITSIIMMVGAVVLYTTQSQIKSPADLAEMLTPTMGKRLASFVMGVALVSAAFSSITGNTTRSVVLLNAGFDKPTHFEDSSIRRNSIIILVISAIIAFTYGGSPTQLILISNVLTNIATPVAGFYMCRLILKEEIYQKFGMKRPTWIVVMYYVSYIVYVFFTVLLLSERIPKLINML
ncbi:divalent metal cation transporter [Tuanshanicoccus lijuaniae]|uniref:NRAMP family divalent metal transporter n=1 Tax=Aerococcaceae bacterium zg-1292 TaxID=2774330 RepID=UPI001938DFC7|nr:divalent metal cation transporter [Aerococcaceae bacterium zg-1292]QQA37026.1 divalent metal cation transporter [Aerococcaceae bacterium zg-1292]